ADLQTAGYLTIQRGRYGGATVSAELPSAHVDRNAATLRRADVEDVLTFRAVVEPAAAGLAAGAERSASSRSHLLESLDAVTRAEPAQYRPLDARLHLAIAELSGSPSLTLAVAQARSRANDLLDRIPFLAVNLTHSNRQHASIVRAVLGGDSEHARNAMTVHLDGTASLLRGFLLDEAEEATCPAPADAG
ncbi:FadR/GntR family transcriptional regulator, partial [Arthrobacter sp. H41]|uniref:FadR/GntR family transcriptional regulator n=1 Tax=Arthrobacter sp. H41 TaxID=1312978 RepID=UPI000675F8C9